MNKDKTSPTEKWEFNESVTNVFDNMLERSIPDYDSMRNLVVQLSLEIIKEFNILPTKTIIDLGCSRGRAMESIYKKEPNCNYIGIEISKPMYDFCRNEYRDIDNIKILNEDLREFYPTISRPDNIITLSILTLCFIPIEYRTLVLNNVYSHLCRGGACIIVEKCLSSTYQISKYLDNVYYAMKSDNQYTEDQIKNKRKALEGVLVPLTTDFNEKLFEQVGFSKIEMFWKTLNFAGWILIK